MMTILGGIVIAMMVYLWLIAIDTEKELKEMKDEYEREKLYKK